MKKLLPSIILLPILLAGLSSCRNTTSRKENLQSEIVFSDTLHHFGIIPLSQPIDSFDFVFTNMGKEKLVILGVETSCHCTSAIYPHQPVESGKQSYIRVIYDGRGRSSEYFNKSIRVITNAGREYVILSIDGKLQ